MTEYMFVNPANTHRRSRTGEDIEAGVPFIPTAQELEAFGDILVKVGEDGEIDKPEDSELGFVEKIEVYEIGSNSITKVLEDVESGIVDPEDVIELEKAGKNRPRLIEKLEDMIGE